MILLRIFTTEKMKEAERLSNEMGVTYQRLMENAGCAAASFIRKTLKNLEGRNCMVFCGSGNNGGDGFVAARKLFEEKANVIVILCGGLPKSDEAKYMYSCLISAGITVFDFMEDRSKVEQFIGGAEVIIDALFGTGFRGEFRAPFDEVAAMINSAGAIKFSFDVPSGINAETGEAAKGSVKADYTVAFGGRKPGHLLLPGKEFCGNTADVDIGIPHEVLSQIPENCFEVGDDIVFSSIKKRRLYTNKGSYGKLLCVTGSENYIGAAAISALSALRAGAGIVTVATTKYVAGAISSKVPEATFIPLPESENGRIDISSEKAKEKLLPVLKNYDAVLIGCGLGLGEETGALVEFVIRNAEGTLIIDADGLNTIAMDMELLSKAKKTPIITPHMGEMARLSGKTVQDIISERLDIATEISKKYRAVTVLKDASTVITAPNGDIYFSPTGNPGLAKGGSGDCLAGIIASLAAQGYIETASAVCGVYLHGTAADMAAKELSEYSMLPSDIPAYLSKLFAEKEL